MKKVVYLDHKQGGGIMDKIEVSRGQLEAISEWAFQLAANMSLLISAIKVDGDHKAYLEMISDGFTLVSNQLDDIADNISSLLP